MDGTLIDTLSDIADSVNLILNKYNFPQHSYAKYKIFIGDGLENLVIWTKKILDTNSVSAWGY